MRTFVLVAIAALVSGCSVAGGLYKDTRRSVVYFEGTGAETFCSEGVDAQVVDIKPIGWGTHECMRRPVVED